MQETWVGILSHSLTWQVATVMGTAVWPLKAQCLSEPERQFHRRGPTIPNIREIRLLRGNLQVAVCSVIEVYLCRLITSALVFACVE